MSPNGCLPTAKPVSRPNNNWTIVFVGIESRTEIVYPQQVTKLIVLLCFLGDIDDVRAILNDSLEMTSNPWHLALSGQDIPLDPLFYKPISVVPWPELTTASPEIGEQTAIPAWMYGQDSSQVKEPLDMPTHNIIYHVTKHIQLATESNFLSTANINHITEMHYCDQVMLQKGEFQLLYNDQILYVVSTSRFLYCGQFKVHKSSFTPEVVGVFVCVENTEYTSHVLHSAGNDLKILFLFMYILPYPIWFFAIFGNTVHR